MFQTRREMKETIRAQTRTIDELKDENKQLQDTLTALDGIGRCASNMCLSCKYALTIGENPCRRAYACLKDRVCGDYDPA